jgi:hypothetical protein
MFQMFRIFLYARYYNFKSLRILEKILREVLRNSKIHTVGSPNLSADRVRTLPYHSVFREGPFWSTAQRTILF